MEPGPAEIARTLAHGLLPATVHLRRHPGRLPVRQATGSDGAPLLLAPTVGALAAALLPDENTVHPAIVLSVDDIPPVAGAPWRGRLWLTGHLQRLDGEAAHQAAMSYADICPIGDLLDVGRGQTLLRMQVNEVRLAQGDRLFDIDPDEFRAAEADPLHDNERQWLTHLTAHHDHQLAHLVSRLGGARPTSRCRAVRLDRYGLVLEVGSGDRLRVRFPKPISHPSGLAEVLHPLLCHGGQPFVGRQTHDSAASQTGLR